MNFAFSLVGDNRATLSRVLGAWATWRHDGEIANAKAVAQPFVEAALDTMLASLGKGDKLEHVWIYAEGDDQGRMIAPLTKGAYAAGIDPKQASDYADKSDRSKKLIAFASDATTLHLFGCHANLSNDSLGAWRNVLAGGRGVVVAPDGFWQLALRSESKAVTITADKKEGCTSKSVSIAPKDRADYEASLRLIDSGVEELVAAGCLAKDRADTMKKERRAEATGHFEKLLREWFDLLQPGGELPPSLRAGTPSRDAILDGMWALWDRAGGIVFPFVANKRVSMDATKGKKPADLVADKALAAAIPSEAGWRKKFVTRPTTVVQAGGGTTTTPTAANEKDARARIAELHKVYLEKFRHKVGGKDVTYGPKLDPKTKLDLDVIQDSDEAFRRKLLELSAKIAADSLQQYLKFGPEAVIDVLVKDYRTSKRGTPPYTQIDENTKLTNEDKHIVLAWISAGIYADLAAVDQIAGFFYKGKIYARYADTVTLAHEMAHGYAHERWNTFVLVMRARGMRDVDKLNEGMAMRIAHVVIDATRKQDEIVLDEGYDGSYRAVAEEFVNAVGEEAAYEAFFGGEIDWTDDSKPEDTLQVGTARRAWSWPPNRRKK